MSHINENSLYSKILITWEVARKEHETKNIDIFTETAHDQEARALEQLLTDRMEGTIEDFLNGLISASEFVGRINVLAAFPVREGE